MKVLVLTADDGYDWSLRVNITDHLLGLVWKRYNLDGIIMVKNAPGDSRWNEIERFWSFRHKGLTIPEVISQRVPFLRFGSLFGPYFIKVWVTD